MTRELSYRLQAADGVSPAHLNVAGALVPNEADSERTKAARQIADISQGGRTLFEQGGAKLMRKGDWIMVKVHANERDDRGRLSPIVCWGRVAGADMEDFGKTALSGLDEFADSIDRTINDDHRDAISRAFRAEKRRALGKPLAAILLLAASAVVVHQVASRVTTKADQPAASPTR